MAKFVLLYRGGKPFETAEEGEAHMEKWRAWAKGLGEAYVYPGMPCSDAFTVSAEDVAPGSGEPSVSGVSVVEADSHDDAVAMARACPHLDIGGDIVVALGIDMEM